MTTDQPTLAVTDEMRRLARVSFALEASQIERDVRLADLTADETDSIIDGVLSAALLARTNSEPRPAGDLREALADRFWLIVREPGMVPDRKGPWPHRDTAKVMREFIAARPRAFLDVLTIGPDGTPDVQHGPEALQMADARSMSTGSKHNACVRAAAEDALATHSPAPMAVHPSLELCIQFSEDGRHIRKWSRVPFDGGECLYSHPTSLEGGEGVEAGPTWRIAGQDSHFGPFVVVDGVPHDQVVVCYWRNQIQPIHLRLPGQAYVADLLRLMDEQQCGEVAIIPVRHKERVSITRSQLAAHPSTQEG